MRFRGGLVALLVGVVAVTTFALARSGASRSSSVPKSSERKTQRPRVLEESGKRPGPSAQLLRRSQLERAARTTKTEAIEGASSAATAALSATDLGIFESPEECERLVSLGHRAPRGSGQARIATWNVRYFPDGVPNDTADSSLATDVPWLGCTLAWLNVDVIALEEVKSRPRSQAALEALTSRLSELTGETHKFAVDTCQDSNSQHLAFIWTESRVTAQNLRLHAAVNPLGEACASQLRPGFGVDLKFKGGLDLHAVAVHLKSGKTERDWSLRRRSTGALEAVVSGVIQATSDRDVLVLGDMNTMGCEGCSPIQRGEAELQQLDTRLRAMREPLRRIPPNAMCSHYYGKQPALLDHFLATLDSEEVAQNRTVEVHGFCRKYACEPYTGAPPSAALHLSDHCPLVLSLSDSDKDR